MKSLLLIKEAFDMLDNTIREKASLRQ